MSNDKKVLHISSVSRINELSLSLRYFPIANMKISRRSKTILEQNDIDSLGDIVCLTRVEAESLKGIGRKTFNEIRNELLAWGLDFSPVSQSSLTRPKIVTLEIVLQKARQSLPNSAIHDVIEVANEKN